MSKLVWDAVGEKLYETGIHGCALYQLGTGNDAGKYINGVAWNGITSIAQNRTGADANDIYADDIKYLTLRGVEKEEGTIEAYTYPEEFEECDGTANFGSGVPGLVVHQQPRKGFGLAYKTTLGNDTEFEAYGYKLHLIYGCTCSPSEKTYNTINDSPEATTFSWSYTTTPVAVTGKKHASSLEIDSTKANAAALATLEAILFGADDFSATAAYAKDEVVTYEGKLYKAKAAVSAGTWSSASWDKVSDTAVPGLPLPDEVVTLLTAGA